jgi:hypothetical protein
MGNLHPTMDAALAPFLRTIRENALADAVDHGQIGTEAEDFADRVLAVAAETMAELERLDRERDAMMDRGDGR